MKDWIQTLASETDFYRSFNGKANREGIEALLDEDDTYESLVTKINESKETCQICKTYLMDLQKKLLGNGKEINTTSEFLLNYARKEFRPRKIQQQIQLVFGTGRGGGRGNAGGITATKQSVQNQRAAAELAIDLKEMLKLIGEMDQIINSIETNEQKLELAAQAAEAAKKQHEADEAERQRKADERRRREEEEEKRRKEREELRLEQEKRRREEEERRRIEEELRKQQEEERKAREAEEQRKRKEEEQRKREEEALRRKEEEERLKREREEEEKRQREEQERLLEEERKKKEEEERQLRLQKEEEERERQKNDPNNWPPKSFTSNEEGDDELVGTIRVRRDKVNLDGFELTTESFMDNIFQGKAGEKAVSNIVGLRSTRRKVKCRPALHLSIPEKYRAERETPSSHWTLVVYERTKYGDIKEHSPESIQLNDIEGTQFADISLNEVDNSVFQVFMRLKIEKWEHNHQEGTQIKPNMDKRISVDIPASAYPNTTLIKTQVIPVTREDISNVRKRRVKSAGPLSSISGASPILHIAAPAPSENLNVEMPIIQGIDRGDASNDLTTNVHVMISSSNGPWVKNTSQVIRQENDKARFEVQEEAISPSTRLMALRTNGQTSADCLNEMAKSLEKQKMGTECAFVVKQQNGKPEIISMNCPKRENTKELIEGLAKQGYGDGPAESGEFYLTEGQVLEIRAERNIKFHGFKFVRMVFYSNIDTAKKQEFISVINSLIQSDYSEYRGYVSLHICKKESDDSYVVDRDDPESYVCKLPITLPKLQRETTLIEKAPFKVDPREPPVTDEYFDEIKHKLKDKWAELASALEVPRSSANQAYTNHMSSTDRGAATAEDILVDWFKRCSRGADKVTILANAFIEIGKPRMTDDLLARNDACKNRDRKENKVKKSKLKRHRSRTGAARAPKGK